MDNTNNGKIDLKVSYTLDANRHIVGESWDINNTGSVDLIKSYELDAQGNVVKSDIDTNADGTIDKSESHLLDNKGRIISTNIDIGNNGSIDSIISYVLDPNGQRIEVINDTNADGSVDSKIQNTFDVYGNLIRSDIDNGNNGSIDNYRISTFDASGRILSTSTLLNVYGKPTGSTTTYTYDDSGRVLTQAEDRLNDGSEIVKVTYSYNDRDQPILGETWYSKSDSIIKQVYEYNDLTYLSKVIRSKADGTIEQINVVESYADGSTKHVFADNGGDGTIDIMSFGSIYGRDSVNEVVDFTAWSTEKLASFNHGLDRIVLSDSTAKSEITLSKDVFETISSGHLLIDGDTTDTVNLTGFTKVEGGTANLRDVSTVVQPYDKYIADGIDHFLYVDADVNVVLS